MKTELKALIFQHSKGEYKAVILYAKGKYKNCIRQDGFNKDIYPSLESIIKELHKMGVNTFELSDSCFDI